MTWDTLFHQQQDAFRKENKRLPKYLYAGTEARALYSKSFQDAKRADLTYAGVPVIWVSLKKWWKFYA